MRPILTRGLLVSAAVVGAPSCSGDNPSDNGTPSGTTQPPSSHGTPTVAPSWESATTETSEQHSLDLPDGFTAAEGWVARPFPEKCESASEQKCNGSCVSDEGEVNGCAFVNSGVIWRGMVSDEQGTYFGQGGTSSNALLFLDPSQHRLVEAGIFAGTQSDSFDLALDTENVYVTVEATIAAFPRSGGPMVLVARDVPAITSLTVVDGVAYGELFAEDELAVIPLNGDPITTVPFEGDGLLAAAPDFFYTQEGAVYRVAGGDVINPTVAIETAPNGLLGVRGDWLYGQLFANNVYELHRWPKAGGAGERVRALSSRTGRLSAQRVLFPISTADAEFVCSVDLDGGDPRVHGYLPLGAPSIIEIVSDDQYVYAAKGTLLARFPL